jgi:excisionase family DNA binding protein
MVMALALLFVPPMENDLEPLRFLTLKQTAELLRMSTRTLLRMVQSNELPAFKVGGQWRFLESELIKWFKASTNGDRFMS